MAPLFFRPNPMVDQEAGSHPSAPSSGSITTTTIEEKMAAYMGRHFDVGFSSSQEPQVEQEPIPSSSKQLQDELIDTINRITSSPTIKPEPLHEVPESIASAVQITPEPPFDNKRSSATQIKTEAPPHIDHCNTLRQRSDSGSSTSSDDVQRHFKSRKTRSNVISINSDDDSSSSSSSSDDDSEEIYHVSPGRKRNALDDALFSRQVKQEPVKKLFTPHQPKPSAVKPPAAKKSTKPPVRPSSVIHSRAVNKQPAMRRIRSDSCNSQDTPLLRPSLMWPPLNEFYYFILNLHPKKLYPPSKFRTTEIPNSYKNRDSYIKLQSDLVLEECIASLRSFKSANKLRLRLSAACNVQDFPNCSSGYGISTTDVTREGKTLVVLTFNLNTNTTPTPSSPSLVNGDLIQMQIPNGRKKHCLYIGIAISSSLVSCSRNTINVLCCRVLKDDASKSSSLLSESVLQDARLHNRSWYLTSVGNVTTFAREYQALRSLLSVDPAIVSLVLNPKAHRSSSTHSCEKVFRLKAPKLLEKLQEQCNTSQLDAILSATTASTSPLTLVQGPPGTGKTFSILGMISACLAGICPDVKSNASSVSGPVKRIRIGESLSKASSRAALLSPKRILVCAPSNAAIDEIVMRILDKGVLDILGNAFEPRVVRVGRPESVSDSISHVLLDTLLDNAVNKLGVPTKGLRQQIITNAQIVCSTLSAAGSQSLCDFSHEFDMVIVDEAAQTVEATTLIPLKFRPRRMVLVGDHRQLPATVLSSRLQRLQYSKSLFQRLVENDFPVTFMNLQYRMHPAICHFASCEFYHSRLQTAPAIICRDVSYPLHDISFLEPYLFFNVKGGVQDSVEGSTSLRNLPEVSFVIELLQQVIKLFPLVELDHKVGIIAPYKQQVEELEAAVANHIPRDALNGIEINTVDGFQGREKDIMIFSCVRATRGGNKSIGFLRDDRRLNVAITRARKCMWIVGDAAMLSSYKTWDSLIKDAKNRERYLEADWDAILDDC